MNAPYVVREVGRPTPEQASAMVAACAPMIARLIGPYLRKEGQAKGAGGDAMGVAKSDEVEGMDKIEGDIIEIEGLGVIELPELAGDEDADAAMRAELAGMGVDPDEDEEEEGDEL